MKKIILLTLLIVFSVFCGANAKTYVVFDKTTGEIKGVASLSEELFLERSKIEILREADQSYRGKHGYEIKYENSELRHATQQEIDDYLDSIRPPTEKEEFLEMLKDKDIKTEIKAIKDAEPIMMGSESRWQRIKNKTKEIYRTIVK